MRRWLPLLLASTFLLAGCHLDMWVEPKAKSQELSNFFTDRQNTRKPVAGTVPFLEAHENAAFYTGFENGQLVKEFPVPVTEELIRRGQDRFMAFCSHCHGALGDGKGMIAQRGYNLMRPVADYHTERLRKMPIGHFFDVMTNGYGAMYPIAPRIKPYDRWAIASYIRTLQFSQFANVEDLDSTDRSALGLSGSGTDTGPLFKPEQQTYPGQPAARGTVESPTGPKTLTPTSPQPPAGVDDSPGQIGAEKPQANNAGGGQ